MTECALEHFQQRSPPRALFLSLSNHWKPHGPSLTGTMYQVSHYCIRRNIERKQHLEEIQNEMVTRRDKTRHDRKEVLLASRLIFASYPLDPNRLLYSTHSLYKPLLFGGSSWPFLPFLPFPPMLSPSSAPSHPLPLLSSLFCLSVFLSTLPHVSYWTLASHLSSSISNFCLSSFSSHYFMFIRFGGVDATAINRADPTVSIADHKSLCHSCKGGDFTALYFTVLC